MSLTFIPETIELFPQTAIGEVEEAITLHQRGRVRFMATTWFARFYQSNAQEALPGTSVKVIGREGLTLLVVPIDEVMPPGMSSLEHPKTKQLGLLGWMQQVGSWCANWL